MTSGQIINELGSVRKVCVATKLLKLLQIVFCNANHAAGGSDAHQVGRPKAGAARSWLANAPGVRGCSALRARADVLAVRSFSSANAVVGAPNLRSMRESCAPILHSHPARLRAGLGGAHGGSKIAPGNAARIICYKICSLPYSFDYGYSTLLSLTPATRLRKMRDADDYVAI